MSNVALKSKPSPESEEKVVPIIKPLALEPRNVKINTEGYAWRTALVRMPDHPEPGSAA